MSGLINEESRALALVKSQGWQYKEVDDKLEIETCPYCKKSGYGHFYIIADGSNRDSLFICHKCGVSGNYRRLREHLGLELKGVYTPSNWGHGDKEEKLPDTEALHEALLADEDAMSYLMNERGFSRDIIVKQKLGLTRRKFRELGDVRSLVYPYLVQGNTIFAHYRSLPPAEKAFSSPKGWDAPLYNGEILHEGLTEIIMVEGEANCIAALDHGITNIVGVPGANFKKTLWIEQIDKINPERIYICYDTDKVGQKAAQAIASKIGIEKCYKIVLPNFSVRIDGVSENTKPGKDLNEWFVSGNGSAEDFEQLKQDAQLFDVQGVSSTADALSELEEAYQGKTSIKPKYGTPWPSVDKLVGFEDGDVVDLVAPEKVGKTSIGMNMCEYAVDHYGEDAIIICLEMTVLRLSKKWVCHVTGTEDLIPTTEEDDRMQLARFREAIPLAREKAKNRPGTLYFCYPQYKTVDDIYKLIKDCIRRYGVKWVMIDNLQRLCDTTLTHQNRTIHLSQISKVLSQIAKDYGVKMIRILQPHRLYDGKVVTTNNVDGASQIAKDCDVMIAIHRRAFDADLKESDIEDYASRKESFDPITYFSIGLTRYSGGGSVKLEFDGARSTLREANVLNEAKRVMGETCEI